MELEILHMIQGLHRDWLDPVMVALTAMGEGGICWILLSAALVLFPKTRKCGFAMMLSMALTFLLGNVILKNVIARLRPCQVDKSVSLLIPFPSEYSFPSGHTSNGFAAAVVVFAYFRRAGIGAIVLAGAIAFTRLYLFVHYPTDILGGILLGTVDACFAVWCIRKYTERKKDSAVGGQKI